MVDIHEVVDGEGLSTIATTSTYIHTLHIVGLGMLLLLLLWLSNLVWRIDTLDELCTLWY